VITFTFEFIRHPLIGNISSKFEFYFKGHVLLKCSLTHFCKLVMSECLLFCVTTDAYFVCYNLMTDCLALLLHILHLAFPRPNNSKIDRLQYMTDQMVYLCDITFILSLISSLITPAFLNTNYIYPHYLFQRCLGIPHRVYPYKRTWCWKTLFNHSKHVTILKNWKGVKL